MQTSSRPRLALGVRVLRHGPDEWQVGLDPRRRLRLPDTADVRRTLAGLREADRVPAGDPVVAALSAHGLLHREADVAPEPPRVLVRRFGAGEVPDVTTPLVQAGLEPVDRPGRARAALLVGFGEPARELTDPWLRDGLVHLVVRLGADEAVVGPLVVPGEGACLRCLDAHHTDEDARWPQLVHRQAELDAVERRDGLRDRADPLLAGLALAWAARDLATHLEGRPVGTRSATLRIPPDLGGLELVSWHQHPECACTW